MSEEILVKVDGVSKKFCRSLKRSLWYGVQDVSNDLFGRKGQLDNLRKNEFWAVDDISFELKRGECLGLIGPNGAGKSTLLKILNGLIKPDKGRVTIRGRVGALIELGAGFNPILTARENIYVNGSVLGLTKKEIDLKFDEIVNFAEIDKFIDTPVQSFSSGMKVRLGFAIAAQMEPDVLIIDEVLAVGDVGFRNRCYNTIYKICSKAAVILVSHSMNHVERTCSRCMLLNEGRVAAHSEKKNEVIQQYLELFGRVNAKQTVADGVVLKQVMINGTPASDTHIQEHDGPFSLEMVAEFPERSRSLELSLSFLSSGFILAANSNSLVDGHVLPRSSGMQKIRFDLPSLALGAGTFHPSLTVRDAETNEILIWLFAFTSLQMHASSYHPGLLQLHGQWESSQAVEDAPVSPSVWGCNEPKG